MYSVKDSNLLMYLTVNGEPLINETVLYMISVVK